MPYVSVLTLRDLDIAQRAFTLRFSADAWTFSTTYWYDAVDFDELAKVHSREAVERLVFHVAIFEAQKLCSLRPARLELGPWGRFWTRPLEALWRQVFFQVWAQWRYEHDDPGYAGPAIGARPATSDLAPSTARAPSSGCADGRPSVLAFSGGGKDSLVGMKLLERANVPFDAFVYSSSVYGRPGPQHALVDALVARCRPGRRLRQWIFDDFLDAPILSLHPELEIRHLTAAETPTSLFGALPLALVHGYGGLCLSHERSADSGQVRWDKTGEDVNHQWGKSFEAETLLNAYIGRELLAGVRYFSLLKPIYDVAIFGLLRRHEDDLVATHSCNVHKPWCLTCPKCLYVWLGYAAFLPRERVRAVFGTDALLERAELTPGFASLLGLAGAARPFECIGEANEARVFLAACAAKGYIGPTVDLFRREGGDPNGWLEAALAYLEIDLARSAIPAEFAPRIGDDLARGAAETAAYLRELLGTRPSAARPGS